MKISIKVFCAILCLLSAFQPILAQSTGERVYLVWLEVQRPSDVAHCYTERFDKQRVAIDAEFGNPLADLSDFAFGEDEMEGPDCFIPELKLIYRNYTYIVSLYCTKVIKYQNASPFTPSNRRVRTDVIITESIYTHLNDLRLQHFGRQTISASLLQQITTGEPLENLTEADINLDELLNEDIDPLDAQLENDVRETPLFPEEDPEEVEEDPDGGE